MRVDVVRYERHVARAKISGRQFWSHRIIIPYSKLNHLKVADYSEVAKEEINIKTKLVNKSTKDLATDSQAYTVTS